MSFATLLNGYALNASVRFTFSEPQPMVGEALTTGAEPTRIVFASGAAVSQAHSTGESTRTAHMSPGACGGEALAPAVNAWRILGVSVSGIASGAVASGVATRLAYPSLQPITGMADAKAFEPERLARPITQPQAKDQTLGGWMLNDSAWHDGRSDGFADSSLESTTLATRLVTPDAVTMTGQADLAPLAYDLTRWMSPRQMRNRAISYVREGKIFKLRVNQQYAEGTAIARASSRGTPNTILAFSITYASAAMALDPAAVKIARDSQPGRAVAEALASGITAQDHSARGSAVATATGHIAPDVTRSGVRYAYAQGKAQSNAALSIATAVRWPMVKGERQPAWAELSVTQLIARDMHGQASAHGASLSDPAEAIVTHAVWMSGRVAGRAEAKPFEPTALRKMEGQAQAISHTTGVPWHWIAVPADGVAQAIAEARGDNPRVITNGAGSGEAEVALHGTAYKVAYVSGRAVADGATLGEAASVARHMKAARVTNTADARAFYPRVTRTAQPAQIEGLAGLAAEARNAAVHMTPGSIRGLVEIHLPWAEQAGETGVRRLRMVLLAEAGVAIAEGGASRNVYKINAGDPAGVQRTLIVPATDRRLDVPASSREYRIT